MESFCPNCHTYIGDTGICKQCGYGMPDDERRIRFMTRCVACGKDISKEALICPHCGKKTALGERKEQEEQQKKYKQEEEKKAVAAGLLVRTIIDVVAMLIGIVMTFANFSRISSRTWYSPNEGAEMWLIIGIALVAGGIIDLVIVKSKLNSL